MESEIKISVESGIKISERMEAHLTGVGFQFTPITPEAQVVSGAEVTQWKWDVTATKPGTQRLHLTLNAIITTKGSENTRAIRTFVRAIDVKVTWRHEILGFIREHWQWLWTAILIPVFGWVWTRRKKTRLFA